MHTAIVIHNTLPPSTLAITPDLLELRDSLVARAGIYQTVTSNDAFQSLDALTKEIIALDKRIEEERVRLKRPVIDFVQAFDAAFSDARTPLITERTRAGKLLVAWEDAENARIKAEHAAKQEEARKAAIEAKRLQDEEAQRIREQAAQSVPESPDDDAPPPFDEPEPAKVFIPTVLPPAPPQMLKSSAVKRTARPKLVIDDASLIPRSIATAVLLVPDEAAITALWKAGIAVPGTRYVTESSIGAK